MTLSVVILAAGQGTRMKSSKPKVLHDICGAPMARYSLESAQTLMGGGGAKPVLVIGHGAQAVRDQLGEACEYVIQSQQLGTGHAVLQAAELLHGRGGLVMVYYADMPLLTADSLQRLVEVQKANSGPLTMMTVVAEQPRGFGRIVRDAQGGVRAIVEEAQATPEQLAIRELNVGAYCFDAEFLWRELPTLKISPKGEYYLTDLVAVAVGAGKRVEAVVIDDAEETIGVNTRAHLAETEAALRRRINRKWMEAGVTIIDPATTTIGPDVTLAPDTTLAPNTQLLGKTRIGGGCSIGPNTYVFNSLIGNGCAVVASFVEDAVLEDEVAVGPYAHLRKGAHLAKGVHLGNFGEVKDSYLGEGVKMGHFSYIGNAVIGAHTNIGAGTVTCNYDGKNKNKTEVGEHVFIGSDTMLVAPVTLGDRARTGAGSVVTKNVPPDSLAVGIPARVRKKSNE